MEWKTALGIRRNKRKYALPIMRQIFGKDSKKSPLIWKSGSLRPASWDTYDISLVTAYFDMDIDKRTRTGLWKRWFRNWWRSGRNGKEKWKRYCERYYWKWRKHFIREIRIMGSVIIIQEWTPGKSISKKSFPTKGAILAQSLRWTFSKQRAACDGISKIVKLVLNTLNVTLIVAAWQFYFEEDSRTHSWNIMKVDQKDYLLDIT